MAGNLMADNLQLVQMSTMLSAFLDDAELHHKAMYSRMQHELQRGTCGWRDPKTARRFPTYQKFDF